MKQTAWRIRPWVIVLAIFTLAPALTIPWTYWVIQATFDNDVISNARNIARRVQERLTSVPDLDQARIVLHDELVSDPTVQVAVYVDLSQFPPRRVGWTRNPERPTLTLDDIERLRHAQALTQAQSQDDYFFTIPWIKGENAQGFTYLDLSRQALRSAFWRRDGSLVRHVIVFSAGAMLVLGAVCFLAMRWYQKMGQAQQRAELDHQGMLAERGLTAAVLAHEIRNPLAALRFQIHTLRKNAAQSAQVAATADTIDQELSRIQTLVSEYLEHERARTMRVQSVELVDACHSLRNLMEELMRQTRTELTVAGPASGPVVVICDPHALRQVLMNLVLNAQQAIATTGRFGQIALRIHQSDELGIIDVSDNGPGIDPAIQQRLFKPFQTSKTEGHGIGLALVKRFADNFGGSVGVDSEIGKGTTFHLRLPLAQTSTPAHPVEQAESESNDSEETEVTHNDG